MHLASWGWLPLTMMLGCVTVRYWHLATISQYHNIIPLFPRHRMEHPDIDNAGSSTSRAFSIPISILSRHGYEQSSSLSLGLPTRTENHQLRSFFNVSVFFYFIRQYLMVSRTCVTYCWLVLQLWRALSRPHGTQRIAKGRSFMFTSTIAATAKTITISRTITIMWGTKRARAHRGTHTRAAARTSTQACSKHTPSPTRAVAMISLTASCISTRTRAVVGMRKIMLCLALEDSRSASIRTGSRPKSSALRDWSDASRNLVHLWQPVRIAWMVAVAGKQRYAEKCSYFAQPK